MHGISTPYSYMYFLGNLQIGRYARSRTVVSICVIEKVRNDLFTAGRFKRSMAAVALYKIYLQLRFRKTFGKTNRSKQRALFQIASSA